MFQWEKDDRILVQMFLRSLEKDVAKWFAGQDKRDVGTWRALTRAFLEHFQFNLEMLPTQKEIEGMHLHNNEGIRNYTYCWRKRASNLKYSMSEEDMISTFLKNLGPNIPTNASYYIH